MQSAQQTPRCEINESKYFGSFTADIIKQLGMGKFGTVYLIQDQKTGKKLALKTEAPKSTTHNQDSQFEREAKIWQSLGEEAEAFKVTNSEDKSHFLLMPFKEGIRLSDFLKADLPTIRIISIFLAILDEIARIHRANIIHRDLHSGNVLIDEEKKKTVGVQDKVNIVDFGLARNVGELVFLWKAQKKHLPPETVCTSPSDQRQIAVTFNHDMYAVGKLFASFSLSSPWKEIVNKICDSLCRDNPNQRFTLDTTFACFDRISKHFSLWEKFLTASDPIPSQIVDDLNTTALFWIMLEVYQMAFLKKLGANHILLSKHPISYYGIKALGFDNFLTFMTASSNKVHHLAFLLNYFNNSIAFGNMLSQPEVETLFLTITNAKDLSFVTQHLSSANKATVENFFYQLFVNTYLRNPSFTTSEMLEWVNQFSSLPQLHIMLLSQMTSCVFTANRSQRSTTHQSVSLSSLSLFPEKAQSLLTKPASTITTSEFKVTQ